MEGFENFVISGAISTLQKFKPVLFIEVDHKNLQKNNSSEKELLSKLKDFGYSLYKVDGIQKIRLNMIENTNEHYDVLCIKE